MPPKLRLMTDASLSTAHRIARASASGEIVPMSGRARLSPYYFVSGDRAELRGVLATVCPPDKKVIHGMRDAIMVPCAVKKE